MWSHTVLAGCHRLVPVCCRLEEPLVLSNRRSRTQAFYSVSRFVQVEVTRFFLQNIKSSIFAYNSPRTQFFYSGRGTLQIVLADTRRNAHTHFFPHELNWFQRRLRPDLQLSLWNAPRLNIVTEEVIIVLPDRRSLNRGYGQHFNSLSSFRIYEIQLCFQTWNLRHWVLLNHIFYVI